MERNDGFQDLAGSIAEGSPYARKEGSGRKLMSVAEMGRILGLGKTDRYWLLHKGFFETRVINRKTSLGNFPIRRAGHLVRIPRKEFSCWLARWRADHGINS